LSQAPENFYLKTINMSSDNVGILIILFFIVMGIATGGKIFGTGPELSTNTAHYNGGGYYDSDLYTNENGTPRSNADTALLIDDLSFQVSELTEDVQKYEENKHVSPHKNKASFYIAEPGTFREHAILNINLPPGEELLISGWKFRSTVTGSELRIGNATNIPIPGSKNEQPILVSDTSEIIVMQGRSPISTSFRINKCAGFLEERNNFTPVIDSYCPAVIDDAPPLSRSIDNTCLDYIESLPGCKVPDDRDFPENLTNACETFLETKVNYESCVANHKNDLDFFVNEWRIFANNSGIIWRDKRDNVQLLDNAGLIVDTYSF